MKRGGRSGPPGAVRIIAGQWRGRRLPVPPVEGLRPTPDRVRETLFNWLAPVIRGARCLDLFAGTGALGLEAASRGAAEVVLVERDPLAGAALTDAAARLEAHNVTIVTADAVRWLDRRPTLFDIVFLDPPYGSPMLADCCERLARDGWLAPDAYIYVETGADAGARPGTAGIPAGWTRWRATRAGRVHATLYRASPTEPQHEISQ